MAGIQGVGESATVRTEDGRVIPISEVGFGDFEIQALYETAAEFPDNETANRFLQIYRDSGVDVREFLQVYLDEYMRDMQGRADVPEDLESVYHDENVAESDESGIMGSKDAQKEAGNGVNNTGDPNRQPPVGAGETYDPDNALALSTRFVNRMDPMWKNSENIKPIEGYQDIVCHGDKTGFAYLDLNGNEINLTPREFAEILKNSPVYEGRPIRLISCEAGADGSITARYMANQLGVPVLAPTDIVYVYPDGIMIVGKYNTGRWVLFNPKER